MAWLADPHVTGEAGAAYRIGKLLRQFVPPRAIQRWSLTSLQQRLFETDGGRFRHARDFVLQLAESQLTGSRCRPLVQRME